LENNPRKFWLNKSPLVKVAKKSWRNVNSIV
jgi:hypothetical protein